MTDPSFALPPGLSAAQAARRLATEGPNQTERDEPRSFFRVALDVLREPMFRLLLAAGAIYLLLGDLGEALMLLAFALGSIAITIVQAGRNERALAALGEMAAPRARVVRDGEIRRIAARELVREDIVLLDEGERVPADLRLLDASELEVDESLLTGESVPVAKQVIVAGEASSERSDRLFAGTLAVRGSAVATVVATGPDTELGRLGRMLADIETRPSALQAQTRRVVQIMAVGGIALSVIVAVVYGWTRGAWLDGALAGIALAMALLPEEIPLVLTVFTALGSWRMARHDVLARHADAIEALGSITVLCTDKTGTLTFNRMALAEIWSGGEPLTDAALRSSGAAPVLRAARLACRDVPVDPMDRAVVDLAGPVSEGLQRLREFGVRPELPAASGLWRRGNGNLLFGIKGAPEAVARLCGLDATALAQVQSQVAAMAGRGLRVLGVADATPVTEPDWPEQVQGLQWRGLIAFRDPLRLQVPEAIAACAEAGVRVIMITGDHPTTALAIAAEAGIAAGHALTGAQIAELDDAALDAALRDTAVFARVAPAQKLRIVERLKAAGEVVAMTGDGVNDAPSLKAADIGVAMGGRGSDVAREAAALVLLDDDFSSLVGALRQGRCIHDNLLKAMGYVLAVHVPIAGLALLPLLLEWPLILAPLHIVFMELVIDPACSIVFEAEPAEPDVMRRPPRPRAERLFSPRLVVTALLRGALGLALVAMLFALARTGGSSVEAARTLAFVGLVSVNLGLILAHLRRNARAERERPRNPALIGILLVACVSLIVLLSVEWLRVALGFELPASGDLMLALAVGPLLALASGLVDRFMPAPRPLAHIAG